MNDDGIAGNCANEWTEFGESFFTGGRKKWQRKKGKEGEGRNVRPGCNLGQFEVVWGSRRPPEMAAAKKWLGQKEAGTKEKHCAGTVLELGGLHFRGEGKPKERCNLDEKGRKGKAKVPMPMPREHRGTKAETS
jgi:hypothetical protein